MCEEYFTVNHHYKANEFLPSLHKVVLWVSTPPPPNINGLHFFEHWTLDAVPKYVQNLLIDSMMFYWEYNYIAIAGSAQCCTTQPPPLPNTNPLSTGRTVFPSGTQVTYTCITPCYNAASPVVTCQGTATGGGTWSPPSVQCTRMYHKSKLSICYHMFTIYKHISW